MGRPRAPTPPIRRSTAPQPNWRPSSRSRVREEDADDAIVERSSLNQSAKVGRWSDGTEPLAGSPPGGDAGRRHEGNCGPHRHSGASVGAGAGRQSSPPPPPPPPPPPRRPGGNNGGNFYDGNNSVQRHHTRPLRTGPVPPPPPRPRSSSSLREIDEANADVGRRTSNGSSRFLGSSRAKKSTPSLSPRSLGSEAGLGDISALFGMKSVQDLSDGVAILAERLQRLNRGQVGNLGVPFGWEGDVTETWDAELVQSPNSMQVIRPPPPPRRTSKENPPGVGKARGASVRPTPPPPPPRRRPRSLSASEVCRGDSRGRSGACIWEGDDRFVPRGERTVGRSGSGGRRQWSLDGGGDASVASDDAVIAISRAQQASPDTVVASNQNSRTSSAEDVARVRNGVRTDGAAQLPAQRSSDEAAILAEPSRRSSKERGQGGKRRRRRQWSLDSGGGTPSISSDIDTIANTEVSKCLVKKTVEGSSLRLSAESVGGGKRARPREHSLGPDNVTPGNMASEEGSSVADGADQECIHHGGQQQQSPNEMVVGSRNSHRSSVEDVMVSRNSFQAADAAPSLPLARHSSHEAETLAENSRRLSKERVADDKRSCRLRQQSLDDRGGPLVANNIDAIANNEVSECLLNKTVEGNYRRSSAENVAGSQNSVWVAHTAPPAPLTRPSSEGAEILAERCLRLSERVADSKRRLRRHRSLDGRGGAAARRSLDGAVILAESSRRLSKKRGEDGKRRRRRQRSLDGGGVAPMVASNKKVEENSRRLSAENVGGGEQVWLSQKGFSPDNAAPRVSISPGMGTDPPPPRATEAPVQGPGGSSIFRQFRAVGDKIRAFDARYVDSKGRSGIYNGEVNDRFVPHGEGTMAYENGVTTEGEWEDGLLQRLQRLGSGADNVDKGGASASAVGNVDTLADVAEAKRTLGEAARVERSSRGSSDESAGVGQRIGSGGFGASKEVRPLPTTPSQTSRRREGLEDVSALVNFSRTQNLLDQAALMRERLRKLSNDEIINNIEGRLRRQPSVGSTRSNGSCNASPINYKSQRTFHSVGSGIISDTTVSPPSRSRSQERPAGASEAQDLRGETPPPKKGSWGGASAPRRRSRSLALPAFQQFRAAGGKICAINARYNDSKGRSGIYNGEVNDHFVPHGEGTMAYDDDTVKQGEWRSGKFLRRQNRG